MDGLHLLSSIGKKIASWRLKRGSNMFGRIEDTQVEESTYQKAVSALVDRFLATSIDTVIMFEQMSEVISAVYSRSCDARDNENRCLIAEAKKFVNKHHGVTFSSERGIGYRRLAANPGVNHNVANGLKVQGRAARRWGNRIKFGLKGSSNDLTPDTQRSANQALAVCNMVSYLAKEKTVDKMPEEPPKKKSDGVKWLKEALGI
jgi:hypothetical protein